MSQTVKIDAATLLQHAANLERYIENLRQAIAIANEKLSKTREARESLKKTSSYDKNEFLVAVDGYGNAFVKTRVDAKAKPIVHLGIDVYAEMTVEEAEKILLEREHVYVREIQGLEKELDDKLEEYKRVQGILYALQQKAQAQTKTKTSS